MRKLFKFERDLAKQIKQLMDKLDETKRELRLEPGERPEGRRGRPGTGRPAATR